GVPSLFSDLSSLYNHLGKADILEQLILVFFHSALQAMGFEINQENNEGNGGKSSNDSEGEENSFDITEGAAMSDDEELEEENNNEAKEEEENNNEEGKLTNPSSSSTASREGKRGSGVRQYVRSKMPRLCWTPNHDFFPMQYLCLESFESANAVSVGASKGVQRLGNQLLMVLQNTKIKLHLWYV
ncbi:hypothetical protein HN873_032820, partial [Arachis hypogaea]